MSKHNPQKAMDRAVHDINQAIEQAKLIANMHGLQFSLSPAYGMGGTYYSPEFVKRDLEYQTEGGCPSYALVNEYEYYVSTETGGWVSSTQECN